MKKLLSFFLIIFLSANVISCLKDLPEVIKVKTLHPTDIMTTTVTLNGEIIDSGEGITDYGHCWALHSQPVVSDFISNLGPETQTKVFRSEIEDLKIKETYYFRAYARRDEDIKYGDVISFTTGDGKASLNTADITEITASSAQSGGQINSAGGSEILSRGVCWNIEGNPTIDDNKTEDGSGTGSFTSSLTGLNYNTEYYARAYAITAVDTSYGGQVSFSTLTAIPIITTVRVTEITPNSAQSGGNVTQDWGSAVTKRGVVWSTEPYPTLENNLEFTNNGSGLGDFSSILTGLTKSHRYYIRAYATNGYGTGYGQQRIFTTPLRDWPTDTKTEVVEVTNPITGKTWMDRNLGATRRATSGTDTEAYGHLYQWGRAADGHQIRTSGTTSTLSGSDTPGHGDFILAPQSPYNWRSPRNDDLWHGENGVNNPCPDGYRLPTQAELEAERNSWSSINAIGAFASPLKLPLAGYRGHSDGSLRRVSSNGLYLSSEGRTLDFNNSGAFIANYYRAYGFSVRCIKD